MVSCGWAGSALTQRKISVDRPSRILLLCCGWNQRQHAWFQREHLVYCSDSSLLVSKAITQTSPSLHVWHHTNLQVPHLYSLSLSLFFFFWKDGGGKRKRKFELQFPENTNHKLNQQLRIWFVPFWSKSRSIPCSAPLPSRSAHINTEAYWLCQDQIK